MADDRQPQDSISSSASAAGMSRGIEHIGITVPDHDAAVVFLHDAFGAEPLFSLVRKDQPPMDADQMGPKNPAKADQPPEMLE